jgi:hypothetical protein
VPDDVFEDADVQGRHASDSTDDCSDTPDDDSEDGSDAEVMPPSVGHASASISRASSATLADMPWEVNATVQPDVDFMAVVVSHPAFFKPMQLDAFIAPSQRVTCNIKALKKALNIPKLPTNVCLFRPLFQVYSLRLNFFAVFRVHQEDDNDEMRMRIEQAVYRSVIRASQGIGPMTMGVFVRTPGAPSAAPEVAERAALSPPPSMSTSSPTEAVEGAAAAVCAPDRSPGEERYLLPAEDPYGRKTQIVLAHLSQTYISTLWKGILDDLSHDSRIQTKFLFASAHGQKCPISGAASGEFVHNIQQAFEWKYALKAAFGVAVVIRPVPRVPGQHWSLFATPQVKCVGLLPKNASQFDVAGRPGIRNFGSRESTVVQDALAECPCLQATRVRKVVLYSEGMHVTRSAEVRTAPFDFHRFSSVVMSADLARFVIGAHAKGTHVSRLLTEVGRQSVRDVADFPQWRMRPEQELLALVSQNVGLRLEVCFSVSSPDVLSTLENADGGGLLDRLAKIVKDSFLRVAPNVILSLPSEDVWTSAARLVSKCATGMQSLCAAFHHRPLTPHEIIFFVTAESLAHYVFAGDWMGCSKLGRILHLRDIVDESGCVVMSDAAFSTGEGETPKYVGDNWEEVWKIVVAIYEKAASELIQESYHMGRRLLHAIPDLQLRLYTQFRDAVTPDQASAAAERIMASAVEMCLIPDIALKLLHCRSFVHFFEEHADEFPTASDADLVATTEKLLRSSRLVELQKANAGVVGLSFHSVSAADIGTEFAKRFRADSPDSDSPYLSRTSLFYRAYESLRFYAEHLSRTKNWRIFDSLGRLLQRSLVKMRFVLFPEVRHSQFLRTPLSMCRVTSEESPRDKDLSPFELWRASIRSSDASKRGRSEVRLVPLETADGVESITWTKQLTEEIIAIAHDVVPDEAFVKRMLPSDDGMRACCTILAHLPSAEWKMDGNEIRALLIEAWRALVPHDSRTRNELFVNLYSLFLRSPPELPGPQDVVTKARDALRRAFFDKTKALHVTSQWAMMFWERVRIPQRNVSALTASSPTARAIRSPPSVSSSAANFTERVIEVSDDDENEGSSGGEETLFVRANHCQPYLLPVKEHAFWCADEQKRIALTRGAKAPKRPAFLTYAEEKKAQGQSE